MSVDRPDACLPSIELRQSGTAYCIPLPLPPDLTGEQCKRIEQMVNEELKRVLAEMDSQPNRDVRVTCERQGEGGVVTLSYTGTAHELMFFPAAYARPASPRELYEAIASTLDLLDPAVTYRSFGEDLPTPKDPTDEDVRRFRVQAWRERGILGMAAHIVPGTLLAKLPWADAAASRLAYQAAREAYEAALQQRFSVFGNVEGLGQRYRAALEAILTTGRMEHEERRRLRAIDAIALMEGKPVHVLVRSEGEEGYFLWAGWRDQSDEGGPSLVLESSSKSSTDPVFKVTLRPGQMSPLTLVAVAWKDEGPTLLPREGASFRMPIQYFSCLRRG